MWAGARGAGCGAEPLAERDALCDLEDDFDELLDLDATTGGGGSAWEMLSVLAPCDGTDDGTIDGDEPTVRRAFCFSSSTGSCADRWCADCCVYGVML